ncbi:hypothetical protein [Halovenus salina]|uniref:Uncharacterized protein n=1 Tax=Halovenus salina TaxID=1510225 RepID=A0ABD5W2E2_9EURY|nr:hypothetical protein [Halovenus salina]
MGEQTSEPSETATREIEQSGVGPAVVAAVGSVALALYYYYVRGDKQRGQFVGLWPTTILALAIYLKLDELKEQLAN